MTNDWNKINIKKIIANDQKEITLMYNTLNSWLMSMTNADEELAHDIFLKIIYELPKYDPKRSKLHNFIYTIGKNMAIINQTKVKNIKIEYFDEFEQKFCNINEKNDVIDDELTQENFDRKIKKQQCISSADKRFLLKYVTGTNVKNPNDRGKFFLIKKKINKIFGQNNENDKI